MKSMLLLLKHIVSPLVLFLFLLLGLIAAFISGAIEYLVIREMLTINLTDMENIVTYSKYVPFIIVLVLEGFKLFLHFVIPAQERENESYHLILRKVTKYFLVGFSLVCTFIFSCNSMYDFNTVASNKDSSIVEINTKYDTEIEKIEKLIEEDKTKKLKLISDEIESINIELSETYEEIRDLDPSIENYEEKLEILQTEKGSLEKRLKEKNAEYDSKTNTIDDEVRKVYQSRLDTATNERDKAIEQANSNQALDSSGDNKYIRATIKFLKSTIKANASEYSRTTYCLIVAFISLLVAIILEIVISTSQEYLSKKSDELTKLFGAGEEIDAVLKYRANKTLKLLVQSAIMLAIFIILGATTELIPQSMESTVLGTKNILITFGSYFISVLFTSGNLELKIEPKKNNSSGSQSQASTFIPSLGSYLISTVVQTLLCIVGFVVLCAITGNPTETIAPSTIALTIGSVSGQILLSPFEAYKKV